MADDQQEVRRINWNEVLTVTHVFKSFRMAIHFSKLALALAAVVLIWLLGLVMDAGSGSAGVYVPREEISKHAVLSRGDFAAWKDQYVQDRAQKLKKQWQVAAENEKDLRDFLDLLRTELAREEARLRAASSYFTDAFEALKSDPNLPVKGDKTPEAERDRIIDQNWREALASIQAIHDREIRRIEDLIDRCSGSKGDAVRRVKDDKKLDTDAKKELAEERLAADEDAAARALTLRRIGMDRTLADLRGSTVFEALMSHEDQCLDRAITAVRQGNFGGGLRAYRALMDQRARLLKAPTPVKVEAEALALPEPPVEDTGLLYWMLMGLHGLGWFVCQHWFYALIFLAASLGIWSLFGGAIHRVAALHFARDEKISLLQALKFSWGKILSFYTAPLIPLLIVVVVGLFQIAGGFLLGSWGGGILMGLLFFLAIIGGLLIAFLLVGLIGGGSLMYPTIAVESSDSFDAISRSYSYVFEKPWRSAFYALAAAVYGAICYLFVRLFAYVALCTTHFFVGAGVVGGGRTISPAADRLDVLWPAPTFNRLFGPFYWKAMTGWEKVGAVLLNLWVLLVAAAVFAFLISYACSAVTVIYFLLRRKVDATDLDDVYVEEAEEEGVAGGEAPSGAAPAAPSTPGEPSPSAAPETPAEPKSPEAGSIDPKPAEGKPPTEGQDKPNP